MIKILTIILLSQLLSQSEAYITSDSGFATGFIYPWTGSRYESYTQQINFQSAFQNVPQVVIAPFFYELPVSSGQIYGYKISISEITTTYFKILLAIEFGGVNTLKMKWFAIDDQRVEVIHQFNIDNPTSSNVPRKNKNINTGFIVLTSFGGHGAIDFVLSKGAITDTYVEVAITSANSNLQNLGYSIVLGPPEAFEISDVLTNNAIQSGYYCSSTINLQTNKIFFEYPLYFAVSSTVFNKFTFIETLTSTTISYCLRCPGFCSFTKFGHQTSFINFQLTTILYPMLMKKIRVSRSYTEANVNNIQIQIGEVNTNYDTIGENIIEIAPSIQFVTMVIKVKCEPNQKVTGKVQRYLSGSNKYFTSSINCFSGQNFISYYARFYQAVQQYQYLIVSITADQILVTQKITNQYLEYYVIAQANLLQS